MPWGIAIAAGVGAAGDVVAGSEQAGAAQTAAGEQEAAATNAEQLNANIFNAESNMAAPERQSGGLALSQLDYLLGLTPNLNIGPDFSTPQLTVGPNGTTSLSYAGPNAPANYNGQPGTSNGGVNSPLGISGSPATMFAGSNYGPGGAPSAGTPGAPGGNLGYGGLLNPYNPSTFYQDPGYQFNLNQTDLALQRQIQSTGGGGSGAALEAAMNYASGLASNEFQSAYNRSVQTEGNIYNMLTGVVSGGNSATGTINNAGTTAVNAGTQAITGAGNAAAAGTIGAANANAGVLTGIGNTIGGLGSMYYNYNTYGPGNPNSPYSNYYAGGGVPQTPATMYATPTPGGGFNYTNPMGQPVQPNNVTS